MESVVVLLSGGPGSTVAAYRCPAETCVHLLHLDYGRVSAGEERAAAGAVAEALGLSLEVIALPHVRQIAGLRGGRARVAELAAPVEIDGLTATLLAVGAEYAAAVGAHALITGQSAVSFGAGAETVSRERSIDPYEFQHAFAAMLETGLPAVRPVGLDAPLIDLQPVQVVKLGLRFEVPFELTWSCYRTAPPCGTCPGCKTRAAAFAQAGVVDPLLRPAGR